MPQSPPKKPGGASTDIKGVITNIYLAEQKYAILTEDGTSKPVTITEKDRVFINDEPRIPRELQATDSVVIKQVFDKKEERNIYEVRAFRPKMNKGRLLKTDAGAFVLKIDEGDDQGKDLTVNVPADLRILLNGSPNYQGKPVQLATLRPGDRVTVEHIGEDVGRKGDRVERRARGDNQGNRARESTPGRTK